MSWIERIQWLAALVLQTAIAVVVVSSAIGGQWLLVFAGTVILALTFAPALIEHRLRVQLPVEFTLLTCVFLYACFILGEVRQYYDRFWWWDLLLHGISALVMGLIGFLALYVFYMTHRLRIAPIYVAVLTFAIAVTVGTIWEIFEFLADWFLATTMQKSGLIDTMTDLMINTMGALIAAIIGYYYVLDGDSLLGERLIRLLVERYSKHVK